MKYIGGQSGHVYKYSMEYFEDMDKQCTILDTELKYMKYSICILQL
jgi:hypothetical protein